MSYTRNAAQWDYEGGCEPPGVYEPPTCAHCGTLNGVLDRHPLTCFPGGAAANPRPWLSDVCHAEYVEHMHELWDAANAGRM